MLLIRRLYVYIICGVSLIVLSVGLINLLDLAFSQAWDSIRGTDLIEATSEDVRREVSLFLALVVVALPVWGLHWYLAERWARLGGEQSDRESGVRAFYFAVVLLVTLFNLGQAAQSLANSGLSWLFGASAPLREQDVINTIAVSLVTIGFWVYHARVRDHDTRIATMSGAGVWPVRAYVYAAALFGAMFLLFGVAQLAQLAVDALSGQRDVIAVGDWWRSETAQSLSLVLAGGLIWAAHWGYSLRLVHGDDWRATSEQRALLRRSYLYVVVLIGVAATLIAVSISLTEALRWLFGVDPGTAADSLWVRLIDPLAFALPFTAFWVLHHRVIRQEATEFAEQPVRVSVERVYAYIVAFAALLFTAIGLAYLLAVLIEFAFESARILDTDPEWVPEQVSQFLSITLIGGAVWAWHWFGIQRRLTGDPDVERSATSRRVFLYLVLTVSTLAVLLALAIALYEVLQIILGVREAEGIAADIGPVLGTLIVASGLLSYHLLILRGDLRFARVEEVEAPTEEVVPVREITLTLSGPAAADLEAVASDLRTYLPDGYELTASTAPDETREGDTNSVESQPGDDDSDSDHEQGDVAEPASVDDSDDSDESERESRIFT